MKLTNQVCTKAQAHRLHELGINNHMSYFAYIAYSMPDNQEESITLIVPTDVYFHDVNKGTYSVSAFTASELAEMLPEHINITEGGQTNVFWYGKSILSKRTKYSNDSYFCCAENSTSDEIWKLFSSKNLASAIAITLIYLLESGLVTADQCNSLLIAA